MNRESLLMKQAMKQWLATSARLQSSSLWKEADVVFRITYTTLALLSSEMKDTCSFVYEWGKGTYTI